MKKLLSLFGLLGLLVFIATPIYAQDDNSIVDDVVAEAENVVDEAVDTVDEVVDETVDAVDETVDNTVDAVEEDVDDTVEVIDEAVDLWKIESFNDIFENEEVQNALGELDLSNEEWAGIIGLIAGLFAGLGMVGWIIGLVLWILRIIALWKAFERAWEWWWKAIVPVYCTYTQFKLAWMKNWFWYALIAAIVLWIIAGIVPDYKELLTNISGLIVWIIRIVAMFNFSRKYNWGVFASVLFFIFYPICVLILGLGNYPYEGKSEKTVVEA